MMCGKYKSEKVFPGKRKKKHKLLKVGAAGHFELYKYENNNINVCIIIYIEQL
jgi:hypothetical protein